MTPELVTHEMEASRATGLVRRASAADGGAKAAPRTVMPCLLHSNSVGYWLGSRGRTATVAEHARAQGLEYGACRSPRDSTALPLLGNSMGRCILQRLVHRILCCWGICTGPDPWERGEAQARIRAEVAGAPQAPPGGAPPFASGAAQAWASLQAVLLSPERGRVDAGLMDVAYAPCGA